MSRVRRILLIQTQAENAGAQEISRLIGAGLAARGYDVRHLFFFRKTRSFDEPRSLRAAVVLASFHHAHESADPIDLLSVGLTKLPEPSDQLLGGLAVNLDLLLYLFQKIVQFRIDFK